MTIVKKRGGKKRNDLTDKVFGKLRVLNLDHTRKYAGYWRCICECGKESVVEGRNLTHGKTKSCGCNFKKELGVAAFNHLFYTYKKSAKIRDLEFNLNKDELKTLVDGECYYCGTKPKNITKYANRYNGQYTYNGIDRKNNNIGYNIENCISCCKTCNFAKKDIGFDQFKEWIKEAYEHLFIK